MLHAAQAVKGAHPLATMAGQHIVEWHSTMKYAGLMCAEQPELNITVIQHVPAGFGLTSCCTAREGVMVRCVGE